MDVDALAQEIRRVDGNHDLGAGALAEALLPFLAARAAAPDALRVRVLEWIDDQRQLLPEHPTPDSLMWKAELLAAIRALLEDGAQ